MMQSWILAGALVAFGGQAPDNSKANQPHSVTAEEQSNKPEDVELTRKIRQDVTSRESFSTYAKNIKIVTRDGVATLRGPVRTTEEKLAIEQIAQKHAGAEKVKSYLEVAPEKGKDE